MARMRDNKIVDRFLQPDYELFAETGCCFILPHGLTVAWKLAIVLEKGPETVNPTGKLPKPPLNCSDQNSLDVIQGHF
jgi:hypothetical protein